MEVIIRLYILCLMGISSYTLSRHHKDGCVVEYDTERCIDIYNCTNYVSNDRYYNGGGYRNTEKCQDNFKYIDNLAYNGHIPIILVYRTENRPEQSMPIFNSDIYRSLTISLDMSHNLFTSYPTLQSMPNLIELNLSHNMLTEAILSNDNELPLLTEINLSYNIINTIEVITQGTPYNNLKKINISHNYLATVPDNVFNKFNKVEVLDFSHNYIDKLDVLTFEGIRELLHLNISHNRISDINMSLLRFNKLLTLDLSHNKLDGIKTNDFEKLYNLTTLDLSYNSLINIHQNVFSLNSLQFIDLSHNLLENIEKEAFQKANYLTSINLSQNSIKVIPKNIFEGKNIANFSIENNRLEGHLLKGMFEGLHLVRILDLSKQHLSYVEDFAFLGLENLSILLLNNNNISTLSNMSLKTLKKLYLLDLSNNQIVSIDFDKSDLISLRFLMLSSNNIIHLKSVYFSNLNTLSLLDLSNNNISLLEPNSFMYLNDLTEFKIANNPIGGILKENTFDGLNLLPNLDISGTLLTALNNNSFKGMKALKELNISKSKINEVQFNAFVNTGVIEVLDLSYNQLKIFNVNTSALLNLKSLILDNNFLKAVSSTTLKGLFLLNRIILSHNSINIIDDDAFIDQHDLRHLDLSFNLALQWNVSQIEKILLLENLLLSGVRTNFTFKNIVGSSLLELEMSYSGIKNITILGLTALKNVNNLKLSNNDIDKVEVGAFSKMNQLRKLDLSNNKIIFIQPSVFKDNTFLYSLNISHNFLSSLTYGIFSGLVYLHTIDISYNNIDNLESERFHDVSGLTVLIADNNKITSLNAVEFLGTSLSTLSIGGNPIPCKVVVALKKMDLPFDITAIVKDEKSHENYQGISCNVDSKPKVIARSDIKVDDDIILSDIRDILRNLSVVKTTEKYLISVNNDSQYLNNITNQFESKSKDFNVILTKLTNLTSNLVDENKNTNSFLDRMLKQLITLNTLRRTTQVPIIGKNDTIDLVPYINKIKQELEDTIAIEKENILAELEKKISSKRNEQTNFEPIQKAHLNSEKSESKSFVFVEVCVGLILVVLIGFVLYKVYNSGVFVPSSRSYSTRNLPEAMENSTL